MNLKRPDQKLVNLPALGMGLFLATGAIFLFSAAFLFAILGLASNAAAKESGVLSLYVLAVGIAMLACLLIPGIYINLRDFLGFASLGLSLPSIPNQVFIPLTVLGWGAMLGLGQLVTGHPVLSKLVLPIANLFVVGLPILLYLRLSLRGLEAPPARRSWSLLGASMLLAPGLAMFFELIAILIVMVLFYAYATTVPGLPETIENIIANLRPGNTNEAEVSRLTATLLYAPGAPIAALSIFSLAIPLIEEICKLTVLGLYLGRLRRPAEGFVLGILSGAAFALAENIGFTSAGSADWVANGAARATTALPHIFNSGLLGWALVSAWREKRYGRLLAAFCAVLLVHGTWNAISLGLAMSGLAEYVAEVPLLMQSSPLNWLAAWVVMIVGTFLGLILCNRQMQPVANEEAVNL